MQTRSRTDVELRVLTWIKKNYSAYTVSKRFSIPVSTVEEWVRRAFPRSRYWDFLSTQTGITRLEWEEGYKQHLLNNKRLRANHVQLD